MRPNFEATLRRGAKDWLLDHLTLCLPLVARWCSAVSILKVSKKQVRSGVSTTELLLSWAFTTTKCYGTACGGGYL